MAAGGGEDFMSDEIVINKCCVCAKKNRRTEAAKYCVECKDYFCKQCVDIHAVFPATEGHKLLDKSDFKSVRSGAGSLPSCPTQQCDEHNTEVLNMYCEYHDEVACATCIGLNHRSCRNIFSIPNNVDNLYKKTEYSPVVAVPDTRQHVAKSKSFLQLVPEPDTRLYKVSKQREINVKVQNDKEDCDITGSCITDDGVLLLVDFLNSKLKRVDLSTETVTDYLNLIDQPIAVCQVSKTEAAVSLENNTVQLVSLGNKITATRTLTFEHNCWGLAYSNGNLYKSDCDESVYVCDMNGKQLQRVTKDASGKNIFHNNSHIAVSAEGERVFVADHDNGLITLDNQGSYLSTLNKSDIYNLKLRGVCTDDKNVYVCGLGTNNVVQLTRDQITIAPIATIGSPCTTCYSICIDSRKSRLYVTKSGRDTITVIELV